MKSLLLISTVAIGLCSFAVSAGDLTGKVKGANGAPKFLVKVEVAGQVAYTDDSGGFNLTNLPNGTHKVKITEQARRSTFKVKITNAPTEKNFTVNW